MPMMTARQRRSFTPEFKAHTVELLRTSGKSVGEICRDLDLTETAVRRWLAQADVDEGRRDGLTTAERDELARLRRENRVGGTGDLNHLGVGAAIGPQIMIDPRVRHSNRHWFGESQQASHFGHLRKRDSGARDRTARTATRLSPELQRRSSRQAVDSARTP
jgi:transposase